MTRDTTPVDLPPFPPLIFREESIKEMSEKFNTLTGFFMAAFKASRGFKDNKSIILVYRHGKPHTFLDVNNILTEQNDSVFTLSVRDTIINEIEPDTLVFHDLKIPLDKVVEQPDGSLSINFEWTLRPAVQVPAARRTNENYVTVFTGEDGQPLPVVDVTKVLPETVPDDKADKLYEQYSYWLSVCTSHGILDDFFPIITPTAYEYSRGIIAVEDMPGDPKDWPLSLLSLWSDYARFVELNLRDRVRAVML